MGFSLFRTKKEVASFFSFALWRGADNAIGVTGAIPLRHVGLFEMMPIKLIAECHPVWLLKFSGYSIMFKQN